MISVEVNQTPVVVRKINGKNGPVELREQEIYIKNGHAYPTRFRITLGRDQAPFAAGHYNLGPRSIVAGEYGQPTIGRDIELIAATKAA